MVPDPAHLTTKSHPSVPTDARAATCSRRYNSHLRHVLQSETIKTGQSVIESDPTSFAAVISPSIKGYTPDQTVVANELASQGEQPIEVTVNYTTEPHEITYSVTDSYNQMVTKTIKVTVLKDEEPVINANDLEIELNQPLYIK